MTRDELRRKLQQTRTLLSEANRQAAADAVAERVDQLITASEVPPKTVALFKSFAAELNTQPIIDRLWQHGIKTALPVLHPFAKGHLLFLNYHADTQLVNNRYGIAEPKLSCPDVIPINRIDWLLMPLVGFDHKGNRLGMGGGYYDRTLAQWRKGLLPNLKPMGLAYDQQQAESIPIEAWDVAVPQIITPSKHWYF